MEGDGGEPRRPLGRGGRGDAMRRAMEMYKRRPGANLEDNGVEQSAVSGGRGVMLSTVIDGRAVQSNQHG